MDTIKFTFLLCVIGCSSLMAQTREFVFENDKAIGEKISLSESGNLASILSKTHIKLFKKSIYPEAFEPGSGTLYQTSMPFNLSWKNSLDWILLDSINISNKFISDLKIDEDNKIIVFTEIGGFSQPNWAKIHTYSIDGDKFELTSVLDISIESNGSFVGMNISLSKQGKLIIGIPYKSNGFVKVFDYEEGVWTETESFSGDSDTKFYGQAVNLSTDASTFSLTKRDLTDVNYVDIYKFTDNENYELFQSLSDNEARSDFGEYIDFSKDGNYLSIGADEYSSDKKYTVFPFGDVSDQLGSVYSYRYDNSTNEYVQRGSVLRGNDIYDMFGNGVKLSDDGLRLFVVGVASIYGSRGYINIYEFGSNWELKSNMLMTNGYDNGYFGSSFDINSDGSMLFAYTKDLSFQSNFVGSTTVYSYRLEFPNNEVSIEIQDKNTSEIVYFKNGISGTKDEGFENVVFKPTYSYEIDSYIPNQRSYQWKIKRENTEWSSLKYFELGVVPPAIEYTNETQNTTFISSQDIQIEWNDILAKSHYEINIIDKEKNSSVFNTETNQNYIISKLESGDYSINTRANYDGVTGEWRSFDFIVFQDSDGDGIIDNDDNCPSASNPLQEDLDDDGIGDVCDPDIDGDGINNNDDIFPFDNTEWSDSDSDGIGDNADNCPSASNQLQEDLDDDGIGDVCDPDIDGDGINNNDDIFPFDNTEWSDSDSDGIGDNADDDDDNDGIKDSEDACPNSTLGAMIDVTGCEVFTLPKNNFNLRASAATCSGSNNGAIEVSAQDDDYTYTATITKSGTQVSQQALSQSAGMTKSISALGTGSYQVCFTVEGQTGYSQCFSINIAEPPALGASARVDRSARLVTLNLSGSDKYYITHNGITTTTDKQQVTIALRSGSNTLEVNTDLGCQGTYFEEVFVSEEVIVYPNPTQGMIQVYVAGVDQSVSAVLRDLSGNTRIQQEVSVPQNRVIELDLTQLPIGVYVLMLSGDTVRTTEKIIKE